MNHYGIYRAGFLYYVIRSQGGAFISSTFTRRGARRRIKWLANPDTERLVEWL